MTDQTVTRPAAGPDAQQRTVQQRKASPVRLGFLGLGWIGLSRLQSIADHPAVSIAGVADRSPEARQAAQEVVPEASSLENLEELLEQKPDGIVIATPSALHADHVSEALRRGVAVYCQKPLALNAAETSRVVREAAAADRLLGVDYCYRHVTGVDRMRQFVQSGQLGQIFAVDLTFHNAYGPDKAWFYELESSGGGCVMDLGTHLIDLALWICGEPEISGLNGQLFRGGQLLQRPPAEVEDAAFAQWMQDRQTLVRLGCSWKLSAGCDVQIRAAFYGTEGAVVLRNVDGSFYDFVVEHNRGTQCQVLSSPPDRWGGRSLSRWIDRLAVDRSFDAAAREYEKVAAVIDAVYGR